MAAAGDVAGAPSPTQPTAFANPTPWLSQRVRRFAIGLGALHVLTSGSLLVAALVALLTFCTYKVSPRAPPALSHAASSRGVAYVFRAE